jgi:DNA-directed RNA polymerase subunit H
MVKRKKPKFDVRMHSLVPKHTKLSQKDKEELLQKYHLNLRQLPRISKDDAAIQPMGPKPGDIIRISRPSQTAGEAIYYRVVV